MRFKLARQMVGRSIFEMATGHKLLVNLAPQHRHKGKRGEEYVTVITPITNHTLIVDK